MIQWEHLYLFAFLAGTIFCMCLTPAFQKLAEVTNFMDRPAHETHKGHGRATPLLGGAAMFSAWLLCLILGYASVYSPAISNFSINLQAHLPGISHVSSRVFFIALGAFLAMLLGLLDDKFGMSAGIKFSGQFVIAALAVFGGGIRVSIFLNNPIIISMVSILWIILMMNAINFFDNMDGLAIGVVTIAMGLFTVVAAITQQYFIAVFSAMTTGVGIGFWFFNHSPATIFMGDSGSHFLGYIVAVIAGAITYFSRVYSLSRFPILIPLFILAVPLFDTAAVVVIRLRNGKPIYIGDHNHISHRFEKMGMSRKRAVQMVHLMALIIGLSVLPILWGSFNTAAVIVVQASLMLLLISMLQVSGIHAAEGSPGQTQRPIPGKTGKNKRDTGR